MNEHDKKVYEALDYLFNINKRKMPKKKYDEVFDESNSIILRNCEYVLKHGAEYRLTEKGLKELRILEDIKTNEKKLTISIIAIIISAIALVVSIIGIIFR